MNRAMIRSVAFVVLALLGAPVALHVVVHDLHGHDEVATAGVSADRSHHDHEHPIVSSSSPQVSPVATIAVPVCLDRTAAKVPLSSVARTGRNVIAFGALRTDSDIGLHSLLATYLI